ncbi:molybdopterin-guanine dinucleotide biosynthesis protein B [Bacillus sp. PAMC26568]|nr:molybdopterin-guanine dinucleotide biosynthesis protein B [Bacillus sp. PAMC26568]
MALGKHCAILQIIGHQNSGKTTLMEKLIKKASEENYRVGTIKHHGHGGAPDHEMISKDSYRHSKAGSVIAGVEGGGVLQLNARQNNWQLSDLVNLYQSFSINLILVEGYKKEQFPKVVMIRDETDVPLLKQSANIKCVICWNDCIADQLDIPVFNIEDELAYIEYIIHIAGDQHETGTV